MEIKSNQIGKYLQIISFHNEYPPIRVKTRLLKERKSKITIDSTAIYYQFFYLDTVQKFSNRQASINLVRESNGDITEYGYYFLLNNALGEEFNKYISDFEKKFPNNPLKFIFRWKFMADNGLNDIKKLNNDIEVINNEFNDSFHKDLTLFVGYTLKGDFNKSTEYFNRLSKEKNNIYNSEVLVEIINQMIRLNLSNQAKLNTSAIYKNNAKSLFSIEKVINEMEPKNLELNLAILDSNKDNTYFYYDIISSKYLLLAGDTNSISLKDSIENIISYGLSHKTEEMIAGRNALYQKLDVPQIYKEYQYVRNIKEGRYREAIDITLEIMNYDENKDKLKLKYSYLMRIAKIYQKNLMNPDSAFSYYKKAFEIKNDKQDESFLKMQEIKYRSSNSIINAKTIKSDKFIKELSGNNLVIFISESCSICKYVTSNINSNIELLEEKKIRVSIIAEEDLYKIKTVIHSYKFPYKLFYNADQLFNDFKITSVPELYFVKNGVIISNQSGSHPNWDLSRNTFQFNS